MQMAKSATAAPRRRAKFKFPAKFGSSKANFGDKTGSLPVFIAREHLELEQADECLCGRKLDVRLEVLGSDTPGQQRIEGLEGDEMTAVATVKKFSVGPKGYASTLQFDLNLIDEEKLKSLAKRQGQVSVLSVEELLGDDEEEEQESEEEEESDDEE
jgi:hypothetical protein